MADSKNTTTLPARSVVCANEHVDPAKLPDQYVVEVQGACLQPVLADGALALIDKTEPYAPGDLVVLYWRPEFLKPGQLQGIVKRLVMAPPPLVKFPYSDNPESEVVALVVVQQLNPQRQHMIKCAELLAVYRCLGPVPAGMKTYRVKSGQRELEAVS